MKQTHSPLSKQRILNSTEVGLLSIAALNLSFGYVEIRLPLRSSKLLLNSSPITTPMKTTIFGGLFCLKVELVGIQTEPQTKICCVKYD